MSWSKTFINVRHPDDLEDDDEWELDAVRDALVLQNEDAEDQIDAALEATKELINSHAFGGDGKVFSVEISGHANPNHEPSGNTVNDFVQIVVRQMQNTEPAVAEVAEPAVVEDKPAATPTRTQPSNVTRVSDSKD